MRFDSRRHPVQVVRDLRERYGRDLLLNFSRYTHVPNSRDDTRESFAVDIDEVTPRWLQFALASLQSTQELALESRVRHKGCDRHIPMLDFQGMTSGQLRAVADALPREYAKGIQVYFSGRSFHAYFPHLLTPRQWIRFMGSALLCNKSAVSVIDQRWIGHRLVGGYAALRWSCASSRHEQLPVRVPVRTLNTGYAEKLRIIFQVVGSSSVVKRSPEGTCASAKI
jgi:hypothetical protein